MTKLLTIGGIFLFISACLLYVWSDYTPNGALGRTLETVSYVVGGLSFASCGLSFAVGGGGDKK